MEVAKSGLPSGGGFVKKRETRSKKMENTRIEVTEKTCQMFEEIRWVIEARSTDPARYHMSGLYMKEEADGVISLVCTDGHRLHMLETDARTLDEYGDTFKAVMSGYDLKEGMQISVEKATKSGIVLGGLIAGQFPNYRKVMPGISGTGFPGLAFHDKNPAVFCRSVYSVFAAGQPASIDYLKALGLIGEAWTMRLADCGDAIPFTIPRTTRGNRATAVIMPVDSEGVLDRGSWQKSRAAWKEEMKAKAAAAKAGKAALKECKAIAAKITVADVIEARAAAGMPDMTEAEAKATAGRIETLKTEAVTEAADMASPPEPAQAEPRAHGELTIRKKTRSKEEKAADRKAKSEQAERQYNGILASVGNDKDRLAALTDTLNAFSPCASYSLKNKAIVIANDTRDARTFLQWKEVNRMVKKGAKAFYIYKPRVFKDREQTDENGNPVKEAVLFGLTPVFRYEDTEPSKTVVTPYLYAPVKKHVSNAA
jgi:hypothetical protein